MIRVLFICHGNICRSVMAEYMLKDMVNKLGLSDKFMIKSKAVSNEEIGNDIYPLAKRCLERHQIPYDRHYASRINKADYQEYDYIFAMDHSNLHNLNRILNDSDHKVSLLLKDRVINDPWYTNDFETTYSDIKQGLELFLDELHLS